MLPLMQNWQMPVRQHAAPRTGDATRGFLSMRRFCPATLHILQHKAMHTTKQINVPSKSGLARSTQMQSTGTPISRSRLEAPRARFGYQLCCSWCKKLALAHSTPSPPPKKKMRSAVVNGVLGVPSPFFPGILLFRTPSKTQGKQPVFETNDG